MAEKTCLPLSLEEDEGEDQNITVNGDNGD